MLRFALVFVFGCKGAATPADSDPPSLPTPVAVPTPLACPQPDVPFAFDSLGLPLFATAPLESRTRTYTGRVTVPTETNLDLSLLWVMDELAVIHDFGEDETDRWVEFEVESACTTCDHAHLRVGSPTGAILLTTPTDDHSEPVIANFSVETTAWMVLGISDGTSGPALAEPITYALRPDLNPFLAGMISVLVDDIALGSTTGIDEHARPLIGSEAIVRVDEVLGVPEAQVPVLSTLPWLLPLVQPQIDDTLVVWGPDGRSAGLPPVDGRFLVDLPFTAEPADYAFRFVGEDSQGFAGTLRYPPDVGTGDLRVITAGGLDVLGTPDVWVVLRTEDDGRYLCRSDALGHTVFPVSPSTYELAELDPQTLEVLAHRICVLGACR